MHRSDLAVVDSIRCTDKPCSRHVVHTHLVLCQTPPFPARGDIVVIPVPQPPRADSNLQSTPVLTDLGAEIGPLTSSRTQYLANAYPDTGQDLATG